MNKTMLPPDQNGSVHILLLSLPELRMPVPVCKNIQMCLPSGATEMSCLYCQEIAHMNSKDAKATWGRQPREQK